MAVPETEFWRRVYKPIEPPVPLWMEIIPRKATNIRKLFRAVGLPAAIGTLYMIGHLVWSRQDKLRVNHSFKRLLEERPELKDYPQDDVRKLFGSIYTINPNVAKDPRIAGELIKQTLDAGLKGLPVQTAKELLSMREIAGKLSPGSTLAKILTATIPKVTVS